MLKVVDKVVYGEEGEVVPLVDMNNEEIKIGDYVAFENNVYKIINLSVHDNNSETDDDYIIEYIFDSNRKFDTMPTELNVEKVSPVEEVENIKEIQVGDYVKFIGKKYKIKFLSVMDNNTLKIKFYGEDSSQKLNLNKSDKQ